MLSNKCFQEFCLFATQGKHSVNTCCHSSPAKTFGQAGRPTQTQRTHENDRGEGVSGMTGSIRHQMRHPRKTMEHPVRHPIGYKVRYPIGRQVSHCQSVVSRILTPVFFSLAAAAADQTTFFDPDRCAATVKACSVNGSALLVILRFNWQLGLSNI